MKIALCQINPTIGDFDGNCARIEAAALGALGKAPRLDLLVRDPADLRQGQHHLTHVGQFVDQPEGAILVHRSREAARVLGDDGLSKPVLCSAGLDGSDSFGQLQCPFAVLVDHVLPVPTQPKVSRDLSDDAGHDVSRDELGRKGTEPEPFDDRFRAGGGIGAERAQ